MLITRRDMGRRVYRHNGTVATLTEWKYDFGPVLLGKCNGADLRWVVNSKAPWRQGTVSDIVSFVDTPRPITESDMGQNVFLRCGRIATLLLWDKNDPNVVYGTCEQVPLTWVTSYNEIWRGPSPEYDIIYFVQDHPITGNPYPVPHQPKEPYGFFGIEETGLRDLIKAFPSKEAAETFAAQYLLGKPGPAPHLLSRQYSRYLTERNEWLKDDITKRKAYTGYLVQQR